MNERPIEILLIDDNEGDIRLVQEALIENNLRYSLHVARDGVEAMDFLMKQGDYRHKPTPDLIFLDLNMPRKSGREVLAEIKANRLLRVIPVVVLTTSANVQDIDESYQLHANCYVTKPVDLHRFIEIVRKVGDFWFSVARLPSTT